MTADQVGKQGNVAGKAGSVHAFKRRDPNDAEPAFQRDSSWIGVELVFRVNIGFSVPLVVEMGDDGYPGVAPVGSFPANGFGLFNMICNVWEWTASSYYPSHEEKR